MTGTLKVETGNQSRPYFSVQTTFHEKGSVTIKRGQASVTVGNVNEMMLWIEKEIKIELERR